MKERVKALRKALDLTQQEFADKIGMKRNTVANYETGRNEPSASVISLICKEFNVNEEWLRTGIGEMFEEIPKEDIYTRAIASLQKDNDPLALEGLLLYYSFPPEQKRAICDYILKLADMIRAHQSSSENTKE